MEPRIQYAKTSDGVNIAYYAMGEGPPLMCTTGIVSHLHFEWRNPVRRSWYERLIRDFRLVRFDKRGTGLSERNITNFSVEALARDIGRAQ